MFKITLALALLGCAFAQINNSNFETFKRVHNKQYTPRENRRRCDIYDHNVRFVDKHNNEADRGLHSFRLGVNKFADLTPAEFAAQHTGYSVGLRSQRPTHKFAATGAKELPATVDWRDKNRVTPVKDQKQCGSCWAFSAIASLEGQHANATGKLVSLSEQELVDCSTAEGNQGCNGGLMDLAFTYIKKNKGVDTEASYPYEGVNATCRFKKGSIGATLTGFDDVESGDETALQEAVATVGPISVAIDASSLLFQLYSGGVYDQLFCGNTTDKLDHAVTAVGYGSDVKDFWQVKNSWGTDWGEKGYIRMVRNKNNQCGIATLASYPLV